MTTDTDNHTIPEKLLLAADAVAKLQSPWPLAQLVVTAWKKWPQTFGLEGYEEQYPHSNKVISAMSGERGMVKRGCFTKIAANTFTIAQVGLQAIKLINEGSPTLKKPNAYSELQDGLKSNLLRKLKNTSAYGIELAQGRGGLEFDDALRFFNGSPRDDILREITELAESDDDDSAEARSLMHLADHLIERFKRQWAIHDERTAKR